MLVLLLSGLGEAHIMVGDYRKAKWLISWLESKQKEEDKEEDVTRVPSFLPRDMPELSKDLP